MQLVKKSNENDKNHIQIFEKQRKTLGNVFKFSKYFLSFTQDLERRMLDSCYPRDSGSERQMHQEALECRVTTAVTTTHGNHHGTEEDGQQGRRLFTEINTSFKVKPILKVPLLIQGSAI